MHRVLLCYVLSVQAAEEFAEAWLFGRWGRVVGVGQIVLGSTPSDGGPADGDDGLVDFDGRQLRVGLPASVGTVRLLGAGFASPKEAHRTPVPLSGWGAAVTILPSHGLNHLLVAYGVFAQSLSDSAHTSLFDNARTRAVELRGAHGWWGLVRGTEGGIGEFAVGMPGAHSIIVVLVVAAQVAGQIGLVVR